MPQWSPVVGERGELRLSINLSALNLKALDLMFEAGRQGFPSFEYVMRTNSSDQVEIWVILLQENHDYHINTNAVVDVWDSQIDALRQVLGRDFEHHMVLLCNFADYLEPVAA